MTLRQWQCWDNSGGQRLLLREGEDLLGSVWQRNCDQRCHPAHSTVIPRPGPWTRSRIWSKTQSRRQVMTNNQLLCRRITINKSLASSQYSPPIIFRSDSENRVRALICQFLQDNSHINIVVVNRTLIVVFMTLAEAVEQLYTSRFAIKRGCAWSQWPEVQGSMVTSHPPLLPSLFL